MKIRWLSAAIAGLALVGSALAAAAPAVSADAEAADPVPCTGFPGSVSSWMSGFGEDGFKDMATRNIYPSSDREMVKPGDYLNVEIIGWWEFTHTVTFRRDGVPIVPVGVSQNGSYKVTDADSGHRLDVVVTQTSLAAGETKFCEWTSRSVPVGTTPTTTTLAVNRTSYQYGDGNSIVATVRSTSPAGVLPGRVVLYRDWYDNESSSYRHIPIATFRNDGKPHQVRLWATYGYEETRTRPTWPMVPALEARFVPDDKLAHQYSGQEVKLRMAPRSPRVGLAMKKRVVARKSRAVAKVSLNLPVGPRTAGKVVLKSRGKVIGTKKVSASGRITVSVKTKRLYDRGRRSVRAYWVPATVSQKASAKGYSVKRVIRIR